LELVRDEKERERRKKDERGGEQKPVNQKSSKMIRVSVFWPYVDLAVYAPI